MNNKCIYFSRLLSASCFYIFLKANTWLSSTDNTVLAFGYRFFILFAPLFLIYTKKWTTVCAFIVSAIGVVLWFNHLNLLGTILFSSGMAVGGFLIKYYASKTSDGAAVNRIALNIGGCLSGIILLLPISNDSFLMLGMGLLLITILSLFFSKEQEIEESLDRNKKLNFSFSQLKSLRGIAWAIIGFTSGVKLMAIMSILPQYLIQHYTFIPRWYGWSIFLNSVLVILLQMPIMRYVQKFSLNQALMTLLSSMVIIAIPNLFFCQTFLGAMIWTFIITIFECVMSYFDVHARQEGTLLIKEFFIGIGMSMKVFMMRVFPPTISLYLLGLWSFAAVILAIKIFNPSPLKGSIMVIK